MAQVTNNTSNGQIVYQQSLSVLNTGRLESIFQKGICGSLTLRNYGQEHQPGYDENGSFFAYVNCVVKAEKLYKAVYDPADGVYHISIEYKHDDQLVQQVSDPTKVEAKFKEFVAKIPEAARKPSEEPLKKTAFLSALKENDSFLKILSERSYKVAVLIIDCIGLTDGEKDALCQTDGFFYIQRPAVDAGKIKYVLLSQKFDTNEIQQIQEKNPNAEFHFVSDSIQDKVPFSYKEQEDGFTTNRGIEVKIQAPDFLPKLTEIFNDYFVKNRKPMFIHTTRL